MDVDGGTGAKRLISFPFHCELLGFRGIHCDVTSVLIS